jgi:hypothetical protein
MTTLELKISLEWKSEPKNNIIMALSTNQYWNERKATYKESPCMEILKCIFYFSNDDFAKKIATQYVEDEAIAYMTEEEAEVIHSAFMAINL